jgi:dienelactone hydrolase
MTTRNLNPYVYYEELARNHKPQLAFKGKSAADFAKWKKAALPAVLQTLGDLPASVPAKPELLVEWEADGLIKQRWVIDVQPGLAATLLINRPANLKRGEKRPAILCCHGHGKWGKEPVMGNNTSPEMAKNMADHNYCYGLVMAKKGFVTFALDWLGFGERRYDAKPHYYTGTEGRDPCNVQYLCATMLGRTVLGSNCHDGKAVTDFVCKQPFVDAKNLGVMGLSLGGTMTTWMALTDERFKAIDVICYTGSWYDIAYRTYNVCGSQVTPGVHKLVDVADLQGMLAPRPLLIEVGVHDTCFEVDYSLENYKSVEKIYKAAGKADLLELDLFANEHAWGGNKSEAFFRKHLGATWAN